MIILSLSLGHMTGILITSSREWRCCECFIWQWNNVLRQIFSDVYEEEDFDERFFFNYIE